jgi:hypothetical protein
MKQVEIQWGRSTGPRERLLSGVLPLSLRRVIGFWSEGPIPWWIAVCPKRWTTSPFHSRRLRCGSDNDFCLGPVLALVPLVLLLLVMSVSIFLLLLFLFLLITLSSLFSVAVLVLVFVLVVLFALFLSFDSPPIILRTSKVRWSLGSVMGGGLL